jgi:hypothetical protein
LQDSGDQLAPIETIDSNDNREHYSQEPQHDKEFVPFALRDDKDDIVIKTLKAKGTNAIDKASKVEPVVSQEQPSKRVTRSGRVVKPHAYMKDYVRIHR